MSTIDSSTSTALNPSNNRTSTSSQATLDAEDLSDLAEQSMQLFLTQLRFQDPTEPMDSSEMTNSLATLTEAGQTVEMNKNLETIIELLGGGGNAQFGSPVSYLGKEIEFNSELLLASSDGGNQISYELEATNGELPESVFVTIEDLNGRSVFSTEGSVQPGKNTIIWDGTDSNGNPIEDGIFRVVASAINGAGEPEFINTSTTGRVTQANLNDNVVILQVGDIVVEQGDVLTVFHDEEEQVASQ